MRSAHLRNEDSKPTSEDMIQQAKKFAAGPLGQETAKYPLTFASSIVFGGKPRIGSEFQVNNGTVSLLRLDGVIVAVTAQHVIEAYKRLASERGDVILQIGDLLVQDPLRRLIDESNRHDLATLRLEEHELGKISPDHEKIGRHARAAPRHTGHGRAGLKG